MLRPSKGHKHCMIGRRCPAHCGLVSAKGSSDDEDDDPDARDD